MPLVSYKNDDNLLWKEYPIAMNIQLALWVLVVFCLAPEHQ